MFNDIDPVVITLVLVGLAIVGTVICVSRRARHSSEEARPSLPAGADAALWSVTEVLPDPRNHLAIKDPTSELRLTDAERAAAAQATPSAGPRPAEAARTAQSLAARRAALAKRSPATPAVAAVEAPAATAAATSPLVIFLQDEQDARAKDRIAGDLDLFGPSTAAASAADHPRWGEDAARAS